MQQQRAEQQSRNLAGVQWQLVFVMQHRIDLDEAIERGLVRAAGRREDLFADGLTG